MVVVYEDGDAAVGVEAEKPLLLLLVGGDIAVVMLVCCSWNCENRIGVTNITVVVNWRPYLSLSSSSKIWTFWPLGVLWVTKWRPYSESSSQSHNITTRSEE